MKLSTLLISTALVVLAGNGLAFSPSSPTSFSSTHHVSALRSATKLLSSTSTSSSDDSDYDYDELMNSEAEQARLANQYSRFGHKDWLRHRASDRFYRTLFEFNRSIIVKNLLDEAAVLAAVCIGIIAWNELLIDGYTDFNEIHHDPIFASSLPGWITFKLALPTEPFFLCGGPLGLLLVFRNDVSFGRYREAFHHWETACSSLSNMMLMASNASYNVEGVHNMGIASWALCRTLQHEVSGGSLGFDPEEKYENDIRQILTNQDQADRLLGARNKLYRAQFDVHRAVDVFSDELTNLDKRTLINNFNNVATACSECERLYTTPIPLLYTRHALKFLTFWMTFMPFAFYDVFASSWNHTLMIPAICIICFLFFGIEEIAVSLEEPFSIIPLDELVEELYLNVEDTTEWMEKESVKKQ